MQRWQDRDWDPQSIPEHMALLPLLKEMESGQVLLRLLDIECHFVIPTKRSRDRPRDFQEAALAEAEWRGAQNMCMRIMSWLTAGVAEDEPRPDLEELELDAD